MFQAPANVAFVVLGLLYGEGDFKKSMIYTISCGDDTDCTGATVGSIMGLMGGADVIPQDWSEYIGDKISSYAIDLSIHRRCDRCTELTERIMNLLPVVLGTFAVPVSYTDGETEYVEEPVCYIPQFGIPTNPYTYDEIADLIHTKVRVEFDRAPVLQPMGKLKMTVTFLDSMFDPRHISLKLHIPEGWSAEYKRHIRIMNEETDTPVTEEFWNANITAGENVSMINKIYLEVESAGRPISGMIPIVVMG